MVMFRLAAAGAIAATLTACDEGPSSFTPEARPVRTVTIEHQAEGDLVALTGQVRAEDQISFAFRVDGQMIERTVGVGDAVAEGQVLAWLDPEVQENAFRLARADLASAEALLTQAYLTFGRQRELLSGGWTTRASFDQAQQTLLAAQAQVDAAQARVRIAQDQLTYTALLADASGVVIAVGAESGEVVRTAQMVVQVAREGGRDAVFDFPEQLIRTVPHDLLVEVVLTNDTSIVATGRVREVAPQADPATRTFQVKVGLIDPPATMQLGSTVTGRIRLARPSGVEVPASVLTEADGRPAVWVVDPQSLTVSLRTVDVLRYDPGSVVISQGLETGEIVVTAGVQTLHPGQKVRML